MHVPPEAFVLITIPNSTLYDSSTGSTESGVLALECVTMSIPEALNDRDVYLVLRLNTSELPIDPARVVQRRDGNESRIYTFHAIPQDPAELVLTIRLDRGDSNQHQQEDLDTFEGILAQYVADLCGLGQQANAPAAPQDLGSSGITRGDKDLRGHLVMVDEKTGEVVGEIEDRFRITEDPVMYEKGHENDPVIIDVPEVSTRERDANAFEAFARIVPPDQRNWITKSASVVSHAISMTTSLLVTTITTASSLYVAHSTPSPHHPSSGSGPSTRTGPPPPPPPRALVFLTSERTQKGLASVHAVSGEAVKVSSKTVNHIDSMIRRAMGARPRRRERQDLSSTPASIGYLSPGGSPPPLPPRTPSPSASTSGFALPSYDSVVNGTKPPPTLPTRPSLPPPAQSPPPTPKLTTKTRVLLSLDLILSTIDDSARRVLDTSTQEIGKVVGHTYGPEAARSSLLVAGTARNVGLVYVDLRGVGRRALVRRAGRTFVKAKMSSSVGAAGQTPPALPTR